MPDQMKILVVDDDLDFLESLQLIIFEQGHQVHAVSNGHDAVELYKKFKPNMVFLDIKMPEIDGYDTFARIKKYDRNAHVILMTGYMVDVVKYTDIEKAIDGTINKPIHIDDLRKIIKKYTV